MAEIKPFVALLPKLGLADRIAAPPYDVLSSNEARAMAAGNSLSFLYEKACIFKFKRVNSYRDCSKTHFPQRIGAHPALVGGAFEDIACDGFHGVTKQS